MEEVTDKLREYILTTDLETRAAFDGFIVDQRQQQKVADACERFVKVLGSARVENVSEQGDRDDLVASLGRVKSAVVSLIDKLSTSDPPEIAADGDDDE